MAEELGPSSKATTIVAETFLRRWNSASRPILVSCNDGKRYVLKGPHNQRAIVNEQVVGRLGRLFGAPVGVVELVTLPEELRQIEPQLADIAPGVAHATEFIPDCSEREALKYWDQPDNRTRFAALVVLYSWMLAGDHQLIYRTIQPNLVYSVDHGNFFPGGPNWTVASLQSAPRPVLDPWFGPCGLAVGELAAAYAPLSSLSDEQVRDVVSIPPTSWGITDDERNALVEYLTGRRRELPVLLGL